MSKAKSFITGVICGGAVAGLAVLSQLLLLVKTCAAS